LIGSACIAVVIGESPPIPISAWGLLTPGSSFDPVGCWLRLRLRLRLSRSGLRLRSRLRGGFLIRYWVLWAW